MDKELEKFAEARDLLDAMVMELRFRGCGDDHKLVRQARRLRRWFDRLLSERSGNLE